MPEQWNYITSELKRIWGYDNFRYPQGEIIHSLLSQKDSLIVMPTGGGKSICFQLPALLNSGLTLVISPLIALMENQVQELRDRQISAAVLHSQVSSYLRKQTLKDLAANKLKLLYLSPETLFSPMVWETLIKKEIKISYLILDEAHCLVQWGDTFRPAYRRLGEVRSSLLAAKNQSEKITIAAFTATADPVAQSTINQVLKLEQPEIFLMNPYRQNINIKVEYVFVPKCREERLLRFIKSHPHQSGLVYARTRKNCEILVELLTSKGYNTVAYHGGLSADERREIEAQWLSGNMLFVVCTCAFGMGVNKPDVRWVVHYQPAYLLSEYVQEIGRAGRDGQPAKALILICEPTGLLYPEDQQRQKYFSEQWRSQYQTALQIGKKIPAQGEITEIEKRYKEGGISLAILHSLGQIKWLDAFNYEKTGKLDKKSQEKLEKQQQKQQRQMQEYLWSQECRWKYILTAFGFTKEAIAFKCGHCDRCH